MKTIYLSHTAHTGSGENSFQEATGFIILIIKYYNIVEKKEDDLLICTDILKQSNVSLMEKRCICNHIDIIHYNTWAP